MKKINKKQLNEELLHTDKLCQSEIPTSLWIYRRILFCPPPPPPHYSTPLYLLWSKEFHAAGNLISHGYQVLVGQELMTGKQDGDFSIVWRSAETQEVTEVAMTGIFSDDVQRAWKRWGGAIELEPIQIQVNTRVLLCASNDTGIKILPKTR